MLPRCDTFKEVIFTPRIIAFNESFVITGKKKCATTAVIWHEAISGRRKEDITSAFYAFMISIRDVKTVILWLDNCCAQNKNWNLFSFFIYIMNSSEVSFERLTVKYFEPGHSFMAADNFHHQVENSLKRMGKVYDFPDFSSAVKQAGSKVNVITMTINDFYNWSDCTSQYKLNKINPRPYLNQMVEVQFFRNKKTLFYKTDYEQTQAVELNFLHSKYYKQNIKKPAPKSKPKGVTKERKQAIVAKLTSIMPPTRLQFWENLPVSDDTSNNLTDSD